MTDWRARDPVQGARQTVYSCCPVLRVLRESSLPVAVMSFRAVLLSFLLVSLSLSKGAVITGACERDMQCGFGLCCAVSLWLRGLRMCVPRGVEGDECHPFSHKVPYPGKRQHHTCPCLPHLACTRYDENKYRCTDDFKSMDF